MLFLILQLISFKSHLKYLPKSTVTVLAEEEKRKSCIFIIILKRHFFCYHSIRCMVLVDPFSYQYYSLPGEHPLQLFIAQPLQTI